MTIRRTVALVSMLCLVPALAQAQDADAAPGASVLQAEDAPDQIIHVNTRIRHTTVIQLPPRENILDFVVGDSEYWHLTGAANLAFLKPIGEGVNTNVALVCESGDVNPLPKLPVSSARCQVDPNTDAGCTRCARVGDLPKHWRRSSIACANTSATPCQSKQACC